MSVSNKFDAPAAGASGAGATSGSPPFSLIVTLQFTEEQYKEQLLRDIAPLAKYIRQHEPDTLAYEVLLSDKDPLRVTILERYRDKDDAYLKVHRSSVQFQEFRPKLKAMQDAGVVEVDGHSYVDSMVGFGARLNNVFMDETG